MNENGMIAEERKDVPVSAAVAAAEDDSAAEHVFPAEENVSEGQAAPKKKKRIPSQVREFIIRVIATAMAVWVTLTFLIGIHVCHSDTCYPMVKDGDLCVTWLPGEPSRGDLIVYRHNGETTFGRVAALPGDRVEIKDGTVWVNGYVALQEQLQMPENGAVAVEIPLTVPEKSVFVLSDNSSDINDSRLYGAIPFDDCRGSVVFLMRRRGF